LAAPSEERQLTLQGRPLQEAHGVEAPLGLAAPPEE
jgi:hypothetical protein